MEEDNIRMKTDHRYKYNGVKCKTPGCEYKARYRGFCINCYTAYRWKVRNVVKKEE